MRRYKRAEYYEDKEALLDYINDYKYLANQHFDRLRNDEQDGFMGGFYCGTLDALDEIAKFVKGDGRMLF